MEPLEVTSHATASESSRPNERRLVGSEKKSETENEFTSLLTPQRKRQLSGQHYVGYGCITRSQDEHSSSGSPFNCDQLSSTTDHFLDPEDKLKQKIKYFFMNPLEKWKAKGRFPWKLILQVVKIIFVTIQLCIFGSDGYVYELQKQNTGASFRHIFLSEWAPIREVVSYPPSTGPYAVYTKPEFYGNVDHVVKMYTNVTSIALGTYGYDSPDATLTDVAFCRSEFKMIIASNSTLTFDNHILEICRHIPPLYPAGDPRWHNFSIEEYLTSLNDTIEFDRLISANIKFSLKTIFLKALANIRYPDCYRFNITVNYDNAEHDGQMIITLHSNPEKLLCKNRGVFLENGQCGYVLRQILNCFIMFICALSLLLCLRCLYKGHVLCKLTDKFFKKEYRKPLSTSEKMEFIDGWYCMMVINDGLIITGSVLKACIEQRTVESDQYATCAILLGTGNLLVWAGVLRYLGFFRKYNILILTLKKALPNVLRFMLCCVLLYGGFCFCGWVVLGPYHIKFRYLSTTSECLFAMMNGDDLFATFAITDTTSLLIWWFSRVYLYLFISMFIYVVISLFISVIMDSYETVKDYYQNGSPLTRIQTIVANCTEDSCSMFYRQQRSQESDFWTKLLMCCKRRQAAEQNNC